MVRSLNQYFQHCCWLAITTSYWTSNAWGMLYGYMYIYIKYVRIYIYIYIYMYIQIIQYFSIYSIKYLINLFSILMHFFLFRPCGCKVFRWKIQKSSLVSWSFGSQWPIVWTLISLCFSLWLQREKCSINLSWLNPRLPSPFCLILDLYWLN